MAGFLQGVGIEACLEVGYRLQGNRQEVEKGKACYLVEEKASWACPDLVRLRIAVAVLGLFSIL